VLLWLRAAGNAGFYDYALLQRVIHYFTYEQAVEILCRLKSITTGKLFISVTGIESAVGETYAGRDVSLSERFCVLEKSERETFMILEPVCLYSEKEFQSLLVDSGWNIEKFWTSAFGNSKAVCS